MDGLEYFSRDGRLGSAEMEGLYNGAGVTPDGVREGDPATLQALVDRRGPAVIAFCTQVCGPANAATAGAEAFARFRAAVRDAPSLDTVDPEFLLRGATRHAAASMARIPAGPPPSGRLRSRGTQTCEHVPTMLAARANGALGAPDLERLARHLDRCERCNAMAEIFHRAELAYQDPAIDTLGTDTTSVLLAALYAVPADRLAPGPAPAGAGESPLPGALVGAFPHLPDLEDEIPIEAEAEPEAAAAEAETEQPEAEPAVDAAPELEVEHVDEPAEELAPEALAAEPLPEEAPALHVVPDVEAEDDRDLGETVEWDVVPTVAEAAAATPAPVVLEGGTKRRSGGPVHALLIALPVLVVAAGIVAALAIAGVFGGNDGTPPKATRQIPSGIQAPVTTPLPVHVKKAAPKSTASSSTTGAATGTAATGAGSGTTAAGTTSGTATGTAATGTGNGTAATGAGTANGTQAANDASGAGTGTGGADTTAPNGGTGAGA